MLFPPFSVSNFPQRNETKTIQKNRERATAISELESKQAKIDQFSSCILCVHKTHTHTRAPREANYHDRMFFTYREEQNRGRRLKLVRAPQSKDLIIVNHASRAEQEEN